MITSRSVCGSGLLVARGEGAKRHGVSCHCGSALRADSPSALATSIAQSSSLPTCCRSQRACWWQGAKRHGVSCHSGSALRADSPSALDTSIAQPRSSTPCCRSQRLAGGEGQNDTECRATVAPHSVRTARQSTKKKLFNFRKWFNQRRLGSIRSRKSASRVPQHHVLPDGGWISHLRPHAGTCEADRLFIGNTLCF